MLDTIIRYSLKTVLDRHFILIFCSAIRFQARVNMNEERF